MSALRQAKQEDLAWVWPAVRGAGLFDDSEELEQYWIDGPWRVQVNADGEAAVICRWREHLDIMAIKGLWCSQRRIPLALEQLRLRARILGFGRLLSPLLPHDAVGPYERSGMTPIQDIIVMRIDPRKRRPPTRVPEAVHVRRGGVEDLEAVLAVDGGAFEDFWRYDEDLLTEYVARERLAVAEAGGEVVGYTLCTVRKGEGSIGRLAVHADAQNRGIGGVLLDDALFYLERVGAGRVTLCTQTDNLRSRSLYTRAGFAVAPGHLVGLVSGPL